MAEDWTIDKLRTKWLSEGVKSSLTPEYGRYTQAWSRHRLAQLAKNVKDVIDLTPGTSRGYDRPAPHVIEAVQKAIADKAFDYPSSKLTSDLRKAISDRYESKYGVETDPQTEVCLTVGAAQAIDCALRILVNPGDEVLVPDPDYGPYEPHVRYYQAKVVPVPLDEPRPGEYRFNIEALRKRVTKRTKLLLMSNANNPAGFLYTREENEAIAEVAMESDFFVVADHVSEDILFDGRTLHNIATLPGMRERTIVCSSFSKAHNLSGFRIGYAVANSEIIEYMNGIIGCTTDGLVTPGCVAALSALTGPQGWIREHVESLQKRRDLMVDRLNKMNGVACAKPQGIYWAFPNIKGLGMPSHELAEYLLVEGGVNVRPGIWYGQNGEGHLRISFCVDPNLIREGMDRMEAAIAKLPAESR